MAEGNLMRTIMVAVSRVGTTIFRNNVAQAVVGKVEWIKVAKAVRVGPGDAVVRNARVLHAGLCVGSSDLVGWESIVVTQKMVGRKIAAFVGLEVKDQTSATDDQLNFTNRLNEAGGIGGVVHSPEEAVERIKRGPGA